MSGLPLTLNCATITGDTYSCCEPLYVYLNPDCVEACVIRALKDRTYNLAMSAYHARKFGTTECHPTKMILLQDLHMLIDLLVQMFHERTVITQATGTDPGNDAMWESYKLDCVARYFSSVHKLNIRDILIMAGAYDPKNPPKSTSSLPQPYFTPCGDGAPDPVNPPGDWPPEETCDIEPNVFVTSVVDASFMGSAVAGTSYLIISDTTGAGNEWADHVGSVVVDGSYTPIGTDSVIEDAAGVLWWWNGTIGGQYFPELFLSFSSLYTQVESAWPNVHVFQGRDVLLEIQLAVDGPWTILYNGPESALSSALILPLGYGFINDFRYTYVDDDCSYGPFDGTAVQDCLITPYVVDYGVDAADVALCYPTGTVFIVSNLTGLPGFTVGGIYTNSVLTALPGVGIPVYAEDEDEYYVRVPGGAGNFFPSLNISHVEGTTSYTFTSQWPAVSAYMNRAFTLEASPDGQNWDVLIEDNEGIFVPSETVDPGIDYLGFKITYAFNGGCASTIYREIYIDIPVLIAHTASQLSALEAKVFRSYNHGPFVEVAAYGNTVANVTSIGVAPWQQLRANPIDTSELVAAGWRMPAGGIVPEMSSGLHYSDDRGLTWQEVSLGTVVSDPVTTASADAWKRVSFGRDGSCWVVARGKIAIAQPGDMTTFDLTVAVPPGMTDLHPTAGIMPDVVIGAVDALNATVAFGWTAGGTAAQLMTMYYTEDGGATWTECTNTSGRDPRVGINFYANMQYLGGGRMLLFCDPFIQQGSPFTVYDSFPGYGFVLISDDGGKTFDRWVTTSENLGGVEQVALNIFSINDGAHLMGREYRYTDDGGDTWKHIAPCGTEYGGHGAFGINSRHILGIGRLHREVGQGCATNDQEPNGISFNKGLKWSDYGQTFLRHCNGVYDQAVGSFGFSKMPRPVYVP